jgi:hypothetical protein
MNDSFPQRLWPVTCYFGYNSGQEFQQHARAWRGYEEQNSNSGQGAYFFSTGCPELDQTHALQCPELDPSGPTPDKSDRGPENGSPALYPAIPSLAVTIVV